MCSDQNFGTAGSHATLVKRTDFLIYLLTYLLVHSMGVLLEKLISSHLDKKFQAF
jgi:hypothetical protein